MKKDIKDYLHLYLGCEVEVAGLKNKRGKLVGIDWIGGIIDTGRRFSSTVIFEEINPILRPLSDMTEEELQTCGNMVYDFSDDPELNNHKWKDFEFGLAPEQFHWLLSKQFDLFGLIESGLAIDKTKL